MAANLPRRLRGDRFDADARKLLARLEWNGSDVGSITAWKNMGRLLRATYERGYRRGFRRGWALGEGRRWS